MPSKKQRAKEKNRTKPKRLPQRNVAQCLACRKTQFVAHMNTHEVIVANCSKSFRTCAFLCNTCNTKDNIGLAKEMLRPDHGM